MPNTNVLPRATLLSIRQIGAMLRARKQLIVFVVVVIVFASLLSYFFLPKAWVASTDIYIDYRENDPIGGQRLSALLDDSYMQTQLDLLRSRRVARAVIDELHLRDTAAYTSNARRLGHEKADQQLIKQILSNTTIQHARGSRVVTVSYRSNNPSRARDISNALADAYLGLSESLFFASSRRLFEQYNAQLEQLRAEIDSTQQQLTQYQREHNILNIKDHGDPETARLQALEKTLNTLEAERHDARNRYNVTQRLLEAGTAVSDVPAVNRYDVVINLKSQLAHVDRKIGDIQGDLGPNHPSLQALYAERNKILQRIKREAEIVITGQKTEIERLDAQIAEISVSIANLRETVLEQMAQRNQIAAYQRQLVNAEQVYETALQKYDDLAMASTILTGGATLLRPAELPSSPVRPALAIVLIAGLLSGLIAGALLALMLELLKRRIRIVDDLQFDPSLPVIGYLHPEGNAP